MEKRKRFSFHLNMQNSAMSKMPYFFHQTYLAFKSINSLFPLCSHQGFHFHSTPLDNNVTGKIEKNAKKKMIEKRFSKKLFEISNVWTFYCLFFFPQQSLNK